MSTDYKVNVPAGTSGIWTVENFTVTRMDSAFTAIRALRDGRGSIPEGTYTRLCRNSRVIMSDTPDEIRDHLFFIHQAKGRVLIHGLGLGMVLQACARKAEVTHVTVVDASPDVIALVAPHYKAMFGDKLEIIEGDAYTWPIPKGATWDCAWHDIWDDLCEDNLPEMTKLHRRFGRKVGYQDSWGKSYLKYHLRRSRW